MKTPIWVYIIIVILSAGAGLAIAGIPDTSAREPTIVPPTTAEVVAETLPAQVDESEAAPTAEATPDTTVAPETTSPSTTTTTTTTLPPVPEPDEVQVTVANGADIGGVAGQTADLLAELGYTDTITRDGTDIVGQTFVYATDELLDFAQRLSDDLGLPGGRVLEIEQAPEVEGDGVTDVIVYLGTDVQLLLVG